jgi:hypothetical protein
MTHPVHRTAPNKESKNIEDYGYCAECNSAYVRFKNNPTLYKYSVTPDEWAALQKVDADKESVGSWVSGNLVKTGREFVKITEKKDKT